MTEFDDHLDTALAGHIPADGDTAPLLAALHGIDSLRDVPPRDPDTARAGLQALLNEAAAMRPAVSAPAAPRRNGWTFKLKKEGSPMFAVVKLALVLALSLGGVGATTVAAQGSLPNDLLYPVKLASEDARLALAGQGQPQIDLLVELASVRTREMARLAENGQDIPESVPLRLQTHLQTALQVAARLGDAQMPAALGQIHAAVQTQTQTMHQAHLHASAEAGEQLRLAERDMTRTRELCELGLSDPQLLRQRITTNRPDFAPDQPDFTPGQGVGPSPQATPCGECTPQGDQNQYQNQEQYQYGPQPTQRPGNPGDPDPQATLCGECTPQGDQNQNQEQHQYGPQPTPAPGNDNGSGPQPTSNPEAGSGNRVPDTQPSPSPKK